MARAANRLGTDNPRFRGENIITLELDMPQRTTRDYEERDMFDAQSGLMPVPMSNMSMSNVFAFSKDEGSRPKSRGAPSSRSGARPSSARKSRGAGAPASDGQASEAVEDFPSAQGLRR